MHKSDSLYSFIHLTKEIRMNKFRINSHYQSLIINVNMNTTVPFLTFSRPTCPIGLKKKCSLPASGLRRECIVRSTASDWVVKGTCRRKVLFEIFSGTRFLLFFMLESFDA